MYIGHDLVLEVCAIVYPLLLTHRMRELERARTRNQVRAENGHLVSMFLTAYFGFGERQDVGL